MNLLFEIEPKIPDKLCRSCEHRERHQCGGSIIQYCAIIKSNRTDNGKLKIKCKTPACQFYQETKNH